jgi:hypothetical protein
MQQGHPLKQKHKVQTNQETAQWNQASLFNSKNLVRREVSFWNQKKKEKRPFFLWHVEYHD